ncbi:unnamed protein product, partial [Phaeothamnion confervicola]
LSQLARASPHYYPVIHDVGLYGEVALWLRDGNGGVRAKAANLVGNLCRHNAYFYKPLGAQLDAPGAVDCC